ncbi:hypothetical protein [uncultured Massilia sp.]|uniref:hypothetical protein n=1 Tax=uncultured Massilia sp. TaxID=169973 RepID=UPI0025886302|nr:hypothetical protein [uncultured Massilia sp.]
MSSFFCERTAEYALVPVLQRALEKHFGSAVPIFYWKTREGNRISSEVHKTDNVRVLAMFARRPKLTGVKNLVAGKINHELFEFADAARSVGIPTIAGFPVVSTLHDLYRNPAILWLPVNHTGMDELVFTADSAAPDPIPTDEDGGLVQILSLESVIEEVAEKAKVLSWDEAMDHISELRLEHYRDGYFGFGWFGGYKPVYFLMLRPG